MSITAVIGTGTWGTAVAALASMNTDHRTILFGRDPAKVAHLHDQRHHPLLGTYRLPAQLQVSSCQGDLAAADVILWAVPTQFSRELARSLSAYLNPQAIVLSLSKGLEQNSLQRVTQVLSSELKAAAFGCLSGPTHAVEVVSGLPFSMVVAGESTVTTMAVERLHSPRCRIYSTVDVIGVEIGGALKNVIAIAAGICEGLGMGDNAKAAIITRGLAEVRRLGRTMGAQEATFAGMAGMGDLLTSCYSQHGRNRAFGLALARGENPQEYLAHSKMVAEGAWTSRAAVALALQHRCELPIASQVANAIWAATPVTQAIEKLLSRAPKEEDA